jgi:exodeoxyribonuclease V alpha subunit
VINEFSGLDRFNKWVSLGLLSQLDRAFVRFLQHQEPNANPLVFWAGALVSQHWGQGKVYLDLDKLCQQPRMTLAIDNVNAWMAETDEALKELTWLNSHNLENWKQALRQSLLINSGAGNTPLVLDGSRLYLRRYWQYQQIVTAAIEKRLPPIRDNLPESMQKQIALLFPAENRDYPDWQKIACILALRSRFTIITGGPGTGKTTTLTKLLALLIVADNETSPPKKLKIFLAAPTGKAAVRVNESIAQALSNLDISNAVKQSIPKKASTLHRLLGSRRDSRLFNHNKNNPLVADIVIVDEASMIDLEVMAALLEALPESAHLILIGDKDQLASVEAGAVLGELCLGAENTAYDTQTRNWIALFANEELLSTNFEGSAINQQTVMFSHSHRFGAGSGIEQLANAVNSKNVAGAQAVLNNPETYQDIRRLVIKNPEDDGLKHLVSAGATKSAANSPFFSQGYGFYLEVIRNQRPSENSQYDQWARQVLDAFDAFRILTALRLGVWGCDSLNQQIEQWLFPKQKTAVWYEGRPVMITRNDYNIGLMNGAIGIALNDSTGKLRVAFSKNDTQEGKNIIWVSPMRLQDAETAFAMTVHKSQGSEFNHVALLLPDTRSPILTRELIYTGITRAKECFTLIESSVGLLSEAILASCK